MKTKLLMSLSALFMGALGLLTSFLPQETLAYFQMSAQVPAVILLQAVGALYLGFAILNWMARANLIGGIYSKPVGLGNLLHFAVVAIVLIKAVAAGQMAPPIVIGTVFYVIFALWFGMVFFTSPSGVARV